MFGLVSKALYTLYRDYDTSIKSIVIRFNSDYSTTWTTSISNNVLIESITVDQNEQNVYFVAYTPGLKVWKLTASSGGIINSQTQ